MSLRPEVATTRLVKSLSELDALASVWDSLVSAGSDTPMQRYPWIRACAETLTDDCDLHAIVTGRPGEPIAIAPLVRRRSATSRLEFIGTRELGEPMDFLYADPAALQSLAAALARCGVPMILRRVPADSPLVPALRRAYRGRGVVITDPEPGWPSIPLDPTWANEEPPLNAGRRSDLRRARRNAERLGKLEYQILEPTLDDVDALVEEAMRVEAANWKSEEGTSLLADAAISRFFRRYTSAVCRQGNLRVCFLRIDGRAAAMQLAVECGRRFWLLKIGYDQEFSRCSPGMLLLQETVKHAAQRGLESYEFLGTVEAWTQVWTRAVRPCLTLRLYPASLRGVMALVPDGLRFVRRKLPLARRGAS